MAEYDGSGNVVTRYVHGPEIDEPLAMIRGGQNYFCHSDNLGSINLITDQSGAVVQRYAYDAFGGFTMSNPSFTQPYTYTAREYDPETGFEFYRNRTLDPNTGTFIQKDPIGFDLGKINLARQYANTIQTNLYFYAHGDPINFKDPLGLSEGITLDPGIVNSCSASENNCEHYPKNSLAYSVCMNVGSSCWANCMRAGLKVDFLDIGFSLHWYLVDHVYWYNKCAAYCAQTGIMQITNSPNK